ncbi:hypothetical protein H257_07421 [Aphanomyces astaci]|uniref:Serine/threonine-protein phosphatase n=1 Tax=Aphanomyces astaci TaxID=112090 RepID=W4GIA5_APHAT|nr:hypothetical protein H257_07421 [Aphanomyces astaci]ETV79402.1 hypothetical protein H257_07421 [Aphanomyces astaci]|eukprot:XP_009831243.1 hypothetical protein H257_07421 [Aphanomyces astaci]
MTTLTPSLAKMRAQFEKQERLSMESALEIIHTAHDVMDKEPNLLYLNAPVVVFGDIHGQFFDLMKLLDKCDFFQPSFADSGHTLLFLGDYVDRGAFSCEVMLFLLCMKTHYPSRVYLLRGNHECESISSFYGFRVECKAKYGLSVYYHFTQCFKALPLAAVVSASSNGHHRVFCVHAGLSPSLLTLADIEALDRRQEPSTSGPLCDLLWSDPIPEADESDNPLDEATNMEAQADASPVESPSSVESNEPNTAKWVPNTVRGCSYYYSCSAVYDFLTTNHLMCMVRAHELQDEGYLFHFASPAYAALDSRPVKDFPPVITVFSAANYCDTYHNMAAYLTIQRTARRFDVEQTTHVVHPFPRSFHQSQGIWSVFQATLPYIPPSNDFFEIMAQLNHVVDEDDPPEAPSRRQSTDNNDADNDDVGLSLDEQDAASTISAASDDSRRHQRRLARRNSNEKHPMAISKALDAISSQWTAKHMAADHLTTTTTTKAKGCDGSSSSEDGQTRQLAFTPQEVDIIKLIFSLMDVDGDLKLGQDEIARFIQRILGDTISDKKAKRYLAALDCNHDGHVDLDDLLSCAAMLKARHDATSRLFDGGDGRRGGMLPWTVLQTMSVVAIGVGLPYAARLWQWWKTQVSSRRRWLKRAFGSTGSGVVVFVGLAWMYMTWQRTRRRKT